MGDSAAFTARAMRFVATFALLVFCGILVAIVLD